ncbi:MAG: hypothetical protein WCB11_25035 [Terriglobales bacterium]
MNPSKQRNDDSTESEDIMLQRNDTEKSNGVQESILLPGENDSSPPSTRVDDWRDLARQIQQETDSSKIVNLVQQLIAKFDEQNSRLPRKQAK